MIQSTFCHIAGCGANTERKLWAAGLHSWETVLAGTALPVAGLKAAMLREQITISTAQLATGDPGHFYAALPAAEHWRLFREFSQSVAYFDIETTGLGGPGDHVTTIAVYDGQSIKHYVHGQNLHEFAADIARYRLLVSYNGKTFDAPFIRQSLGVSLDQAHIDLRYVLASLGFKGGLKSCERQLGLDRQELADVDGFFAVLLWQDYRRGNPRALETLLAYNITDVVNLATLMVRTYNLKLRATPFAGTHTLAEPVLPAIPFQADAATIQRLRRAQSWGSW
ncbi:MAG: ribonuclease H-like domain-containing protein [Verrucomicrobiota bacterium]